MIEQKNTSYIKKFLINGGEGVWMVKDTLISDDNKQEDNISSCYYYVY